MIIEQSNVRLGSYFPVFFAVQFTVEYFDDRGRKA